MKLLRESIIILGIYLLGEFISKSLKIPIPGNIIGMLLLLILLCTKVVKVEQVENISNFFLDHLAFFFIPAGVGILNSFGLLKDNFLKLILICLITTAITIAVTGLVVQFTSKKFHKDKRGEDNYEYHN